MDRALKKRLQRQLAVSDELFHEQVRKRIGKRATANLETKLKDMILLIPVVLAGLWSRHRDNQLSDEMKKVVSYALMHPYKPKDPSLKDRDSLFGYLDDAYSVSLLYEMTLQKLKKYRYRLTRRELDFLRRFKRLKRSVQMVIPYETDRIAHLSARSMANVKLKGCGAGT